MKLASLPNGTRDGELVVVSRDLSRAASARAVAPNLLDAMERWSEVEAPLRALYAELEAGRAQAFAFDQARRCRRCRAVFSGSTAPVSRAICG